MTRRIKGIDPASWASGLFEGEGSIGAYPNSTGFLYPSMVLAMTDEDTVRRFQEIVGAGTIRHTDRPGKKRQYRWVVRGHAAVYRIVRMLWPGLGTRRRSAASKTLWVTRRYSGKTKGWPQRLQATCKRGHDILDESNVYRSLAKPNTRYCRKCICIRREKYRDNGRVSRQVLVRHPKG